MPDKKRILFVCIENSCRSQITEGFAKKFGEGKIEVFSAGSKPSGIVNPKAIVAMKEIGIDISNQRSKGFVDLPYKEFDYLITMGCKDVCPFVPSKEKIDWEIGDPKGKSIEEFRKVRDNIESKVESIIEYILKG